MNTRMKNSGVEWIGDIPEDWSHNTIFQLFVQVKNKNVGLKEKNLLSLSYGKIKRRNIDALGGLLPENFEGYNIIKKDDIVLRLTDLQNDQTSLRTGIAKENGMITSAYLTIRNQSKNLPQFLAYFLYAFDIAKGFYGMGEGIRQGLTWDGIKWLRILVPPKETQQKIVAFLDAQCAELDAVLEKTRQTVEEYKKLKQAAVTQAVTRGVRGKRTMKDSGIQWIGEIPTEWEFLRVSRIAAIVRGGSPRPAGDPRFFNGDYIPWITVAEVTNVIGNYIESTTTFLTKEGAERSRIVEAGTLLLSNSGATLGVPKITKIRGCINDGSVAFYDLKINQMYLLYVFASYTEELRKRQQGYGQPNLNTELIKALFVPRPPEDEQAEIAAFLDRQCAEIDALIAKKEEYLSEIETYKKSLIYEVVTGKREVA